MTLGCKGLRRESEVQETVQVCVVLVQYRVRVTTGFQLHTFWRFQYSTILSPTPSLLVKKLSANDVVAILCPIFSSLVTIKLETFFFEFKQETSLSFKTQKKTVLLLIGSKLS